MTEPLISSYKLKQNLLYRKALSNDDIQTSHTLTTKTAAARNACTLLGHRSIGLQFNRGEESSSQWSSLHNSAWKNTWLYCDTFTPGFMIAESLRVHFLTSFLFCVIPWERGLSEQIVWDPTWPYMVKCACVFSLNEVGSHLVLVERSSVTIGAAKMAFRMPACVIDNGTGWVIGEEVDATRDEQLLLLPMIWLENRSLVCLG